MEEILCYQFTIRSQNIQIHERELTLKHPKFLRSQLCLKKKFSPEDVDKVQYYKVKKERKERSKQACIYLYLKANPSILLHFIEFINSCFHIYHNVPGNIFYFIKPQLSWNLDVKKKWVSFLSFSFFLMKSNFSHRLTGYEWWNVYIKSKWKF